MNQYFKIIIILNLLLFLHCEEKQYINTDGYIPSCTKGINEAEFDFSNRNFVLFTYENKDKLFEEFFNQFLKKECSIRAINFNPFASQLEECYEQKMTELLLDSLGKDFEKKITDKANKEYEKILKIKIDTGFIFNYLDKEPQNEIEMRRLSKLIFSDIKDLGIQDYRNFASIIINNKGNISDISLYKSYGQEIDGYVNEILRNYSDWEPGIYRGRKVNSNITIPINIKNNL